MKAGMRESERKERLGFMPEEREPLQMNEQESCTQGEWRAPEGDLAAKEG
jgi:hypothetical protein